MSYYGVYIPVKGGGPSSVNNGANTSNSSTSLDSANDVPHKDNNETDVSAFVFENKIKALQVLKQHKDARLKKFPNEEDATKFAQTGCEIVQNKYNDPKASTDVLEKVAFKPPTKQQLVRFRQRIEDDNPTYVKQIIWENPRYLVSSGDTPTILKEGYRYNAMHVCAISNSPKCAKLILETISDPKFADLLMGKNSDEKLCKELCANLLDYYLNIPEKGRNETPLHFAAKFGNVDIVAILTSYPQCKMLRNSQGFLPKNIVCDRASNRYRSKDILNLLEERYYVPVLRCTDSAIPAQIGEPFPASKPPTSNCDPLTPEMEIKAVAGPMSQEEAKKFFRRWKTPPRLGSNVSSPIRNNFFISPMKPHNSTPIKTPLRSNNMFNTPTTATSKRRSLFNSTPQRHDSNAFINSNGFDKSLLENSFGVKLNLNGNRETELDCSNRSETNNNNPFGKSESEINTLNVSLKCSIPLYKLKNNAFSVYREQNVASPMLGSIEHIQEVNDSLLNVSDIYDSASFKERHVKNTDAEKGLECIGRVLAKEEYIEWSEYWDFLESFVDIASEKGLKKLENYLAQRQKDQDQRNCKTETRQKPDLLDDVCNVLENAFRISSTTATSTTVTNTLTTSTTLQSATPYTYVEKSLQVHARRMTKTIIHNTDNEVSIVDALLLELRRVKSLIYSFKEDSSYINVSFEKVHSRIGNLVAMFLENSQEVSKQMKCQILVNLKRISGEQGERREHMECVCSRILQRLQHPIEQIPPEKVKSEELCSEIWSQEEDCDCQWESNLSRKTSHRNRMEARYKNHQRLKQQEKLQKDLDNQQKVCNQKETEDSRNTKAENAQDNSSDEDEFWSDFGDSDSDENEVFLTPPESPSLLDSSDETDDDSSKIFIYGNEPTKRDLDVLNAIFHVNIDKTKYPNIHSWKSTITRYPSNEMEFFPSPRTVKKSHSFMAISSNKKENFLQPQTPTSALKSYSIVQPQPQTPTSSAPKPKPYPFVQVKSPLIRQKSLLTTATSTSIINSSDVGIIREPSLQLSMSTGRTKSLTAIPLTINTNATSDETTTTTATATATTASLTDTVNAPIVKLQHQHLQPKRPLTPLNKLRGLFSAYRECQESSPLSTSSMSPTTPEHYNCLQ